MNEQRWSQRALAKKIGIPISTLNSRLLGKTEFRLIKEVLPIAAMLNIPHDEIMSYFLPGYDEENERGK